MVKKSASYLHRTAQPHTLAIFRSWGSSVGAGRIRLADCKYKNRNIKRRPNQNKIQYNLKYYLFVTDF